MFFYINYCLEEQHFYNIKHFFLLFFWQMNETENATHPRFKSHNTLLVHAPNPCRIPSFFIGQITHLYTHQYTHSRTHTHTQYLEPRMLNDMFYVRMEWQKYSMLRRPWAPFLCFYA